MQFPATPLAHSISVRKRRQPEHTLLFLLTVEVVSTHNYGGRESSQGKLLLLEYYWPELSHTF